MKRHNKERKERMEDVPEIFKDLWGFNFVEEVNFYKVKNETWPKIRLVVSNEDENKVKMIRALLQKYEFPFSNLKIVSNSNKKEEPDPQIKPETDTKPPAAGNKSKLFKVNTTRFRFKAS
jgi:hypothetical protein